ncbi:MAG: FAD-dependent monooxygenase [Phycisphaerales bacterium]|nr:MAG: FAD-dependent monooxygenase [Phycisphaerales bacterium]
MTHPRDTPVTVVGAGLGGALMANHLAHAGYPVQVYERRPDPRQAGISEGRSINLAISVRGLHALQEVGLDRAVLDQSVAMRGRMIHSRTGELSYQPYSRNAGDAIYSVSRGALNLILVDAAERHGVGVHFGCKCTGLDLETGLIAFEGNGPPPAPGGFVVGADGAFSAIRARMERLDRFDYSQSYLEHGYKELTLPAGPGGAFAMEKNALHIWPRQSFMMIALPNFDGSYTCTLFWPYKGRCSFEAVRTEAEIVETFEREFPDAIAKFPDLVEQYQTNPVGSLVTIRCGPWYVRDKVVLLGDAAHAVVPFYGQGANAAFEDCTVLSACLREHADRATAFREYYTSRKRHADALADLAVENFVEMRDRTADPKFRRKKKLERRLHGLFPRWCLPLYNMVTFSRIPYDDARTRARRQDAMVRRVAWGVAALAALALLLSVSAILS